MELSKILNNLQIEQLNPMQEATIEACQSDKDIVLLSPTGSGKTLAFLLPLVQSLSKSTDQVQAVILVPSRELAMQIETVFKSMGSDFNIISCYGGRPAMEEHRAMNNLHPAVIVGTPGRMNDHLSKENFSVDAVKVLIIDEFDKCLEFGFQDEMSDVISKLPALKRRILLSATNAEEIPLFTGLNEVIKLNFLSPDTDSHRLEVFKVLSPEKDKLETLYRLLCSLGSGMTLVFCNYRESVDRVTDYLKTKKFPCDCYHGGMEQPDRERALYKFRNGSCPVLVSTDLAARGLDIPGINNIVHYHLPVNEESYIHRNGRTARWEEEGKSFLIVHNEEVLPKYVDDNIPVFEFPEVLPKPMKPLWTTLYIGKGKKDKLNKIDIAGFLYKKGGLSREEVGQVDVRDHYSFVAVQRSKVKQLLTLIQGEKIKGIKTLIEEAR